MQYTRQDGDERRQLLYLSLPPLACLIAPVILHRRRCAYPTPRDAAAAYTNECDRPRPARRGARGRH